jgi:hypothetical protein
MAVGQRQIRSGQISQLVQQTCLREILGLVMTQLRLTQISLLAFPQHRQRYQHQVVAVKLLILRQQLPIGPIFLLLHKLKLRKKGKSYEKNYIFMQHFFIEHDK